MTIELTCTNLAVKLTILVTLVSHAVYYVYIQIVQDAFAKFWSARGWSYT